MESLSMGRFRNRRDKRGQGLVEFALVLPIFLLMLFGIVDLGRLVYMNSTLSQAAREGARLAAVEVYWVGSTETQCGTARGPVCPADLAELRAHVLSATNRMLEPFSAVPDGDLHISCDPEDSEPSGDWTSPPETCSSRNPGDVVSVRVAMDYQPITPIIGQLIGSIDLAGSATMTVN